MTWCNVPIHNAVATSAALGFPIALAATLGYVIGGWNLDSGLPGAVGYLWLPALAVIASASVLLAPLGARTAHAMNVPVTQAGVCLGAVCPGGVHAAQGLHRLKPASGRLRLRRFRLAPAHLQSGWWPAPPGCPPRRRASCRARIAA
jgi:hypothetical protein